MTRATTCCLFGLYLTLVPCVHAEEPTCPPGTNCRPNPLAQALMTQLVADNPYAMLDPNTAEVIRAITGAAAAPESNPEAAKIVEENPSLVGELLRIIKNDEAVAMAVYSLGPAATPGVIAELGNDDAAVRQAAGLSLMYLATHEETPRSQIVKALLVQLDAHRDDAERAEFLKGLLAHTVMATRPQYRAMMRIAVEQEMGGGFGMAFSAGGATAGYVTTPAGSYTVPDGSYLAPPVAFPAAPLEPGTQPVPTYADPAPPLEPATDAPAPVEPHPPTNVLEPTAPLSPASEPSRSPRE